MKTKGISTIELDQDYDGSRTYQGYQPPPSAPVSTHPEPPPPYDFKAPILNQPVNERSVPYGYGQPVINQPTIEYSNFHGHLQPISNQPIAQNYSPTPALVARPEPPPNCPSGLEYLSVIDQLLVHQKIELLEAFTGYETKNKFHVKNSLGQDVYYAVEDSGCCARNCCGSVRPFGMKIFDNYKNEVIHVYRPLACQSCCFPCCLQSVEISSPPGTIIGWVRQEWSLIHPTFAVKNENRETVLRIQGPFVTCSCGNDVDFRIMTCDGRDDVGKITKQWSGLGREAFTDADNFGITFPGDLDVKMKAVLLGALFLIDAMYYERTAKPRDRRH